WPVPGTWCSAPTSTRRPARWAGCSARSAPEERDPPVAVLEGVGDVAEPLLAEHPLEGDRLEGRVDDEHLVGTDGGGRRHDLLERLAPRREGGTGVDDVGPAGDVDHPLLRAALDGLPAELARTGGVELVPQRHRVVVVDEAEGVPGGEGVEALEDRLVPHPWGDRSHVEGLHRFLLPLVRPSADRYISTQH